MVMTEQAIGVDTSCCREFSRRGTVLRRHGADIKAAIADVGWRRRSEGRLPCSDTTSPKPRCITHTCIPFEDG